MLRVDSVAMLLEISVMAGRRVTAIDLAGKCVSLGKETIDFDKLVLCTGDFRENSFLLFYFLVC